MIYTDGIHLVGESLTELHQFAECIGLKRNRFHGLRKGHPHYDLLSSQEAFIAGYNGAVLAESRMILLTSQISSFTRTWRSLSDFKA